MAFKDNTSNKLATKLSQFILDIIAKYRFVTTGVVLDIINFRETPEGQKDTSRPQYAALVEVKGSRQVVARIASTNAGQVVRGSDPRIEENRHAYGDVQFPEVGERVIILLPFGNQRNPIIIGRYYGDATTDDKVPAVDRGMKKNLHISGTTQTIDLQGDFLHSASGYIYDPTTDLWSTTLADKSFAVVNQSGSKIHLEDSNAITLQHSSGAYIKITADGEIHIYAKKFKVNEMV